MRVDSWIFLTGAASIPCLPTFRQAQDDVLFELLREPRIIHLSFIKERTNTMVRIFGFNRLSLLVQPVETVIGEKGCIH